MTFGRIVVFIIIYAVVFFALDRINGTAFDLVGLIMQAIMIGAFWLAARSVQQTPTKRSYIDEHGNYQERDVEEEDQP